VVYSNRDTNVDSKIKFNKIYNIYERLYGEFLRTYIFKSY
jgi:hypothetical protein